MANYEEARIKLTTIQLHKLKFPAKNKTRTTLRITKENFEDEELPQELFLTTRQKIKTWNAFGNNMLTDIKLSQTLLTKTIHSGGFLGNMMSNLGRKNTNQPHCSFDWRCFA